jgi:hypothetical protein
MLELSSGDDLSRERSDRGSAEEEFLDHRLDEVTEAGKLQHDFFLPMRRKSHSRESQS